MARLALHEKGVAISMNVAQDLIALKNIIRQTKESDNTSAYAIGPATVAISGAKSAVKAVHEVAPGVPVIYWHTPLEIVTHFGEGSPVIEPSIIPVLKEGGASAVMGFLNKKTAENVLSLAKEHQMQIIFAGQTLDGYHFAAGEGIREFLIGNDASHMRLVIKNLPSDANLWTIPQVINPNVLNDLHMQVKGHSLQLLLPTTANASVSKVE